MTTDDLKKRFKAFAINTAKLIRDLQPTLINLAYTRQLIRSSSSAGTNYRAALRGKSTADFINKLKIVEEELDESIYFLELLEEFNPDRQKEITLLCNEGNEFLAIIVATIRTTRANNSKS